MNKQTTGAETSLGAQNLLLLREQWEIARRIHGIIMEQEQAIAALPDEDALARVLSLLDERQECMDLFDRVSQARQAVMLAMPSIDQQDVHEVHKIATAMQDLFQEAAQVDIANRKALEQQRDLMRDKIHQVKQGREALRSYGQQESHDGSLHEGVFVDQKK